MNGFTNHPDLQEVFFEEPKGVSMKSFDAFRMLPTPRRKEYESRYLTFETAKTKPTYLTRTRTGSGWTLFLIAASVTLILSETRRWFAGTVTQAFSVEKGVSHSLQINVDVVVAMHCEDVHINVQDAAGDRIMAGDKLTKDPTAWHLWGGRGTDEHKLASTLGDQGSFGLGEDEDVHDYLGAARKKRKFKKTPKLKGEANACRVYGSLEGNKVQGDFHITARGHGYLEFGQHLDHSSMCRKWGRRRSGKLTNSQNSTSRIMSTSSRSAHSSLLSSILWTTPLLQLTQTSTSSSTIAM
jgi:hypothetical protein